MGAQQDVSGPDFGQGVPLDRVTDGATLAGHVEGHPVLLSRRGGAYFAVSGACTHYGAPLGEGFIYDERVMCPWHHACFDLKSGEALAAPAFAPLTRWRTEAREGKIFVTGEIQDQPQASSREPNPAHPRRIVIVGAGAAGFAAADMLRRRGFAGELVMLDADAAPPSDRPNLSKDYLAGAAPEEWIPLREPSYYAEHSIELRLGETVVSIDRTKRELMLQSGQALGFDRLLLATGAAPRRPADPSFRDPKVLALRTPGDARAIIAAADAAHTVAILGASFIGLEVAASLRARGLNVHVIAPEAIPMQRLLGPEVGGFVRDLHIDHGVRFHLQSRAESYDGRRLKLDSGAQIEADFVVLGVGVTPNTALAEAAGLDVADGVLVDAHLRTSDPDIFAAGDIARYNDPRTGKSLRLEHWVAAQRQGQTAALNLLGGSTPHSATPFFWSKHYDHSIHYVGHAPLWNAVEIDGSVKLASFTAYYLQDGHMLAAASLGRDREALELQHVMDEAGKLAAERLAVEF